jgi:hypothetical protein
MQSPLTLMNSPDVGVKLTDEATTEDTVCEMLALLVGLESLTQ